MDINIKIKLECPELMAALLALAEALPNMRLGNPAPDNERQAVEAAAIGQDVAVKKDFHNKVTIEAVRAKLEQLYNAGKDTEVKALVKKFGASKLTQIAEEHYEDLLREADAIYLN